LSKKITHSLYFRKTKKAINAGNNEKEVEKESLNILALAVSKMKSERKVLSY
jgi:hypothetical protein